MATRASASLTLEIMRRLVHDIFLVSDDELDRKSTRLNSSHSQRSYAVFCLKKKTDRDWSSGGSPAASLRLAMLSCDYSTPTGTNSPRSTFPERMKVRGPTKSVRLARIPCAPVPVMHRQERRVYHACLVVIPTPMLGLVMNAGGINRPPDRMTEDIREKVSQLGTGAYAFFFFMPPAPPKVTPFPLPDAFRI